MIHQMHKNGHVFKEKSLKSMQGLFNGHATTKNGYTQVLYKLINRIQMKLGVLGNGRDSNSHGWTKQPHDIPRLLKAINHGC